MSTVGPNAARVAATNVHADPWITKNKHDNFAKVIVQNVVNSVLCRLQAFCVAACAGEVGDDGLFCPRMASSRCPSLSQAAFFSSANSWCM